MLGSAEWQEDVRGRVLEASQQVGDYIVALNADGCTVVKWFVARGRVVGGSENASNHHLSVDTKGEH